MIKFFVDRPLFTASVFIILAVVGLFSLTNLPLDLLPDISYPAISVITVYPGASAEDIETTVTKKIEDAISTVPNLDKITSNSSENMSMVTVSFKWGTNLDSTSSDIRDKIDLIASQLPDDAQTPVLFKFDLTMIPVLQLGVTADKSYDDLYHICDKKISQALKRVAGVGTVNIIGGKQRQINVDVDRVRLDAYRIPIAQVIGVLQAANMTVPVGSLKVGDLEYSVRIPGEYVSIREIADTIIGSYQGRNVYVKDIAQVSDSFVEQTSTVRVNGKLAVMMTIQKQSGTNTVQVSAAAQKMLKNIKDELPSDVEIVIASDNAEEIRLSIENLRSTLMWALMFVMLTVFFFLRNVRGSLIISSVIPFSLIAAFIYLYFSKSTINIISLSSIIIAIGMVVDNAIVVLENVYTHRNKKGEPLRESAIFGTGEVAGAVLASTITNLVVFVPLIMVQGFAAIFFQQLAFTTAVVMTVSLIASISLTPMLASKFLDEDTENYRKNKYLGVFIEKSEKWFNQLDDAYQGLLVWALANRRKVVIGSIVIFFISMPLFMFVGSEFFPSEDSGQIIANVEMPIGTRWENTSAAMEKIENIINDTVPEKRYMLVRAGNPQGSSSYGASMFGLKSGSNYGMLLLRLVPKGERHRSSDDIQHMLTGKLNSIPGISNVNFLSMGGANTMMGGGKPISIEIYGYDINTTDNLAERVKAGMQKIPGITDITISRDKGNPEIWFKIDRQKASSFGLNISDIAYTIRNNLYGNAATKYRDSGDEYDIFVRLKEENRQSLEDVQNIFVPTRAGNNIPLLNLAKFELRSGPLMIERKNQERLIKVEANVFGRSVGDINSDIRNMLSKIALPQDIYIKYGGSAEQMKESFGQLGIALLLGIILIYLVMVAQFESLLDPLVIMFSVPFALVGVAWGLLLSGTPFGIMPFVGAIMVVGIVVNNAIVLIDYTNILRARGIHLRDAILAGGRSRLRPILMTTGTTILGVLPIILSRGEGSEFWTPLGYALLGGMLVSTIITLVIVPVGYALIEEKIKRHDEYGREIQ